MSTSRFFELHREPEAILTLGIVGQFWKLDGGDDAKVRTADEFVAFDRPGFVVSAIDFELERRGTGTRVTTRTRNRATDEATARRFRWYWMLIGAGSKAIRLDVLRAVRRRAEAAEPRGRLSPLRPALPYSRDARIGSEGRPRPLPPNRP